jgi:hypothetical protein
MGQNQARNTFAYRIGLLGLGVLLVFSVNLFIARNFVGGTNFYINWSSARLLTSDAQNPYENASYNAISENAQDTIFFPLEENEFFAAPIFSLFLYYPLLLVKDFQLARAIWMTLSMIGLLAVSLSLNDNTKVGDSRFKIFISIFIIGNVFSIVPLLSGELFLVSFILLLLTYSHVMKGDFELAGIFCGLAMVSPGLAVMGMLIFTVYSARQHQWGFLVWFLITNALLIFSGYLLLDNWVPYYLLVISDWVKQFLATLRLTLQNISQVLLIAVPVLLIIFEWLKFLNGIMDKQKEKWLINFSFSVVAIIGSVLKPQLFMLTLPAWLQIATQWYARNNPQAKTISVINLAIYLGVSITLIFSNPYILVGQERLPQLLILLASIHLLVNMLWIRGWIDQDLMKKVIEHM